MRCLYLRVEKNVPHESDESQTLLHAIEAKDGNPSSARSCLMLYVRSYICLRYSAGKLQVLTLAVTVSGESAVERSVSRDFSAPRRPHTGCPHDRDLAPRRTDEREFRCVSPRPGTVTALNVLFRKRGLRRASRCRTLREVDCSQQWEMLSE
jgi:hypothetical protein